MGILLSNGDSFTYGDELEGYVDNQHDPHTFTHKLASKLHMKYVNLARNGSSNMKIFRTTLDFLMHTNKKIDLVVIMWTNWGRFEVCEPFSLGSDKKIDIPQENNFNQIIPSHKSLSFAWSKPSNTNDNVEERDRILKEYTENVLTMQTQIYHGLTYMKTIQYICDLRGIAVIQGVIHGDMYLNYLSTLKNESDNFQDYREGVVKVFRSLRPECKVGLGGDIPAIYNLSSEKYTLKRFGHADEDSHTEFADMLFNITEQEDWFEFGD